MTPLDRTIAPPIHHIQTLDLKAPENHTLANGIPVKLFRNSLLDLIHCTITVQAGSFFEPQKHVAAACFNLLKESHPHLTSSETDEALDTLGTSFSANTNLDTITLKLIVPKKNCREALALIGSFLCTPNFRKENLDIYKQHKIKDIEYKELNMGYRATQNMFRLMFNNDRPYSTILQTAHIESLTCEQLQFYHQIAFVSEKVKIYLTGNVDDEVWNAFRDMGEAIGEQKNEGRRTAKEEKQAWFSAHEPEKHYYEERTNAMQSALVLCKRSIGYQHPDRRDFHFLSTVLGGYFGSRLMQNLRERNGYTYGIYASSIYFGDASIFYIETDVNVAQTQAALQAINEDIALLIKHLVEDNEIETVRNYLSGIQLRFIENSVSYMNNYQLWDNLGADETEIALQIAAFRNITATHLQSLAAQYLLPQNFTTIIIGNK
ncbi:MAG: insulinase family protein [Bacteroidales bacterium]|jgi:predicted Zn-dependent peptidase|nr:insulinase family protein [Bacteroidales bacterium]